MTRLSADQVALVVNALREKASGDREAIANAKGSQSVKEAAEWAAGPIAATLEAQAVMGEQLAAELEGAQWVEVLPPPPPLKKFRVVYSSYHPVSGALVNGGVEFVPAENAEGARKLIARDGDPDKGITARVVTGVTLDVRDPGVTS